MAAPAAAGGHVTSVTVTRGDTSPRFRTRPPGDVDLGAVREAELLAAMAELGVNDVVLLRRPGSSIDPADPGHREQERTAERFTGRLTCGSPRSAREHFPY